MANVQLTRVVRLLQQLLAAPGPGREVKFALAPAFTLEGTLTIADTGKPVPHARPRVMPAQDTYQFFSREQVETRAEARGHFRFSTPSGNYFFLAAYSPAGTAYLLLRKEFERRMKDVCRKIDFALPKQQLGNTPLWFT
jgi:hypothetical protein